MRAALCLLLAASSAAADPKAVQALAKQNIVELAKLADDPELGLADDAIVVDHRGMRVELAAEDGCVTGAVANAFYGCNQAEIEHRVGTIDVGVDAARGLAWFQAPFTAIASSADRGAAISKDAMRTSGIAVRDGKQWKIVAQLYALLVSDQELLAGTDGKPATGAPKLAGDAKLAKIVAGWFASGFAPAAAKTTTVLASGTSAKEHATGAGALRLVASFDRLKLGATAIDARLLAGGKVGWVVADVMMPRKRDKGAVAMKLALVVVPDPGGWRWVSLQYQFPWDPVGR